MAGIEHLVREKLTGLRKLQTGEGHIAIENEVGLWRLAVGHTLPGDLLDFDFERIHDSPVCLCLCKNARSKRNLAQKHKHTRAQRTFFSLRRETDERRATENDRRR